MQMSTAQGHIYISGKASAWKDHHHPPPSRKNPGVMGASAAPHSGLRSFQLAMLGGILTPQKSADTKNQATPAPKSQW